MLTFRYVLAGWEGSSHDGAVLEAAFEQGLQCLQGNIIWEMLDLV
jgi:hypothetical protein